MIRRNIHIILTLALATAAYMTFLGRPLLWDNDETANAGCAKEMMERRDPIIPVLNQELRPDKPPLLYWFQMTAFHIFGANEFAARFFPCIFALLTAAAVYGLASSYLDRDTGWISALVLLSSLQFAFSARFANPDTALTLFVVLGYMLFIFFITRKKTVYLYFSSAAFALAALAKGPVAAVVPLVSLSAFLIWNRVEIASNVRPLLRAAVIFVLISAPWYVLAGLWTGGEFWRAFFVEHNIQRFLETREGHFMSIFVYPFMVVAGFFPWSGPVVMTFSRLKKSGFGDAIFLRFLVCWIGAWIVFFSFSRTQLPNYILPAYPAIAILTGRAIRARRKFCLINALLGVFLVLLANGKIIPLIDEGKEAPVLASILKKSASGRAWIASYRYFYPSLVYYSGRAVTRLRSHRELRDFLDQNGDKTGYLILRKSDLTLVRETGNPYQVAAGPLDEFHKSGERVLLLKYGPNVADNF